MLVAGSGNLYKAVVVLVPQMKRIDGVDTAKKGGTTCVTLTLYLCHIESESGK